MSHRRMQDFYSLIFRVFKISLSSKVQIKPFYSKFCRREGRSSSFKRRNPRLYIHGVDWPLWGCSWVHQCLRPERSTGAKHRPLTSWSLVGKEINILPGNPSLRNNRKACYARRQTGFWFYFSHPQNSADWFGLHCVQVLFNLFTNALPVGFAS